MHGDPSCSRVKLLLFHMKMELNYLLMTMFLAYLIVNHANAQLEANGTLSNGSDANELALKHSGKVNEKVDSIKKGDHQVGAFKGKVEDANLDKSNAGEAVHSKEALDEQKGMDNGRNENSDLEKETSVDKSNAESEQLGTTPPVRKESFQGEECDSSNSCMDANKTMVACLRVPGNDSPELSLLIQNKGKGPLSITISAPDFVRLEEKQIQLQGKENKKIMVSVSKEGTGNFIILTAGNGDCKLDFRDIMLQTSTEADNSSRFIFINLSSVGSLSLAAFFVVASLWLCISLWRHFMRKGSKYQRLDDELPITNARKAETQSNGWDDGWGDDWDDEAGKTPLTPATPKEAFKGIASRRFSKEGWND